MRGLRVHLTGSAAATCDVALITAAHEFVRALTKELVAHGAGLVVGVGSEPRGDAGEPCIFDWTALQTLADAPDPAPEWPALRQPRFVAVASQRGLERIPYDRAAVWKMCCKRSDFQLDVAPPGWRMAGIIRERQVLRGDILAVLGGGAGAEHLAEMYRDEGKPVIPIYVDLGALHNDGNGGSRFLHQRALANPDEFFKLSEGAGSAAARLTSLRLSADISSAAATEATVNVLGGLRPQSAFYVRLLDPNHENHAEVERFFRQVVDAVVLERGFTPREMGRDRPERAFMNVEVFESLHRAGLVVVDLTGVRPNCTMELGYALARRRRVVISAKEGTTLPFDEDKLPTFFWGDSEAPDERLRRYRDWFDRYSELPAIVE